MERCIFNFDFRLLDSSTLLANSAPVFKECPLAVWLSNRLCAGRTQTISLTKIITLSRCRIGKTGFFVPSFVAKGIKKTQTRTTLQLQRSKEAIDTSAWPSSSQNAAPLSQAFGTHQTPWTNTVNKHTGGRFVIFRGDKTDTVREREAIIQRGLYKTFFFLI